MDAYERSELGKIVIIKNIVFKNSIGAKHQVDHAWKKGRPCVIIYSDDEFDYYLPLSSTKANKNYYQKIKDEFFELSEKDFIFMDSEKKYGVIHITELHKKKTSGYTVIGKITKETYYELIHKIKNYHNQEFDEFIKEGGKHEHK